MRWLIAVDEAAAAVAVEVMEAVAVARLSEEAAEGDRLVGVVAAVPLAEAGAAAAACALSAVAAVPSVVAVVVPR
jgi:hypothetical protein